MSKPNYRCREGKTPVFAVQFLNNEESIAKIMEITGCNPPDRETLRGIDHNGEHFPLGSWLMFCDCEECAIEGDKVSWWTDDEFREGFEAIDNVVADPSGRISINLDGVRVRIKIEGDLGDIDELLDGLVDNLEHLVSELKGSKTDGLKP
jgi:hypothetical protein